MFGWLKRLFGVRDDGDDVDFDWDFEREDPRDIAHVDFRDPDQVERYVRNCCEQMREATEEIDACAMEFNAVTERLRDMEEIEAMPPDIRRALAECARTMMESDRERDGYMNRRDIMPDEQYRRIERNEGDFPEAIDELKKNEEYKGLVKKDLKNLEGEKMSYRFRRSELRGREGTLKSLVKIAIVTEIFTLLFLLFLQIKLELSVSIGYLLCVAAGAIALTSIYISYSGVKSEKKKVEKKLNQAIVVQNRVKIRYVNVTGLIEYSCDKYGVNTSDELSWLWNRYLKEKKERERFRELDERSQVSAQRLLELLGGGRVRRPELWLRQSAALVDPREMVEIRHELVARRGSLRKRINYNEDNRSRLREEVKQMALSHPELAELIMEVVEEYD